ncbi:MAG: DUF1573 domain-containing protein [Bacteroidota bacterium]
MLQKNIRVWMLAFLPVFGGGLWSFLLPTLPAEQGIQQAKAAEVLGEAEEVPSYGEVIGHIDALLEEERVAAPQAEIPASSVIWTQPGQVRFNTMTHKFSPVKEGDKVRFAFEIQNRGDFPIVVDYVGIQHPQLHYFLQKKKIPAGERALLEVVLRTEDQKGLQLIPIRVYINQSPVPYYLSLEGMVE